MKYFFLRVCRMYHYINDDPSPPPCVLHLSQHPCVNCRWSLTSTVYFRPRRRSRLPTCVCVYVQSYTRESSGVLRPCLFAWQSIHTCKFPSRCRSENVSIVCAAVQVDEGRTNFRHPTVPMIIGWWLVWFGMLLQPIDVNCSDQFDRHFLPTAARKSISGLPENNVA